MAKQRLRAGTSGFDKPWKGTFYPEDIKKPERLAYYAARLPTVEINNTFYRLPKPEVLESWFEQTPDDFQFAIKASRRITHIKRLNDVEDATTYLMETTEALKHKLGPFLFQLPPNAKKNTERLKTFLGTLLPCAIMAPRSVSPIPTTTLRCRWRRPPIGGTCDCAKRPTLPKVSKIGPRKSPASLGPRSTFIARERKRGMAPSGPLS